MPEDSKSILPSAENLISNLLPPPERNFPRYSLLIIRIEIRNIAHWKSISRTPNPAPTIVGWESNALTVVVLTFVSVTDSLLEL